MALLGRAFSSSRDSSGAVADPSIVLLSLVEARFTLALKLATRVFEWPTGRWKLFMAAALHAHGVLSPGERHVDHNLGLPCRCTMLTSPSPLASTLPLILAGKSI